MEIAPAELVLDIIETDEAFARAIFSPHHLKSNGKDLKPNAFYSPRGKNEVSVNRTKFCTGHFCKNKARAMERPESTPPKIFRGFALVAHGILTQAGAFVRSSKQVDDAAHADIYYPENNPNEYGQPQTAELNSIVDTFLPHTKYFADPNAESDKWDGEVFWSFGFPS
ncbi:MAG: hypothetical protein ACKVUS_09880 [Saprospiraceae bacterium]